MKVYGNDRSGRPDEKRDHELKRGPTRRRSYNARQLGCVFQDMKPPKSILRKSTNMQRPIQRVKFTKAVAGHAKIRDQNTSLGYICPSEPHHRSPNAPKFEDRCQEETAKQRGSWPKVYYNKRSIKEQHSSHFRKISACLHQLLNLRKENFGRLRCVNAYDQQKRT